MILITEIADELAEGVEYRDIYLIPRYLLDKISDAKKWIWDCAVVDKISL